MIQKPQPTKELMKPIFVIEFFDDENLGKAHYCKEHDGIEEPIKCIPESLNSARIEYIRKNYYNIYNIIEYHQDKFPKYIHDNTDEESFVYVEFCLTVMSGVFDEIIQKEMM